MQNDDTSLRNLLLKVEEWIKFLWSKKLLIIIVGLIGGALGLTISLNTDPKYKGELTFVLEEGNQSSLLGAYSGLASQFGIDLSGGGAGNGLFQGDNILEFLKSRMMIQSTLLSSIIVEGKEMTMAECYIGFNKLRESWKGKGLENVFFPLNADHRTFSRQQDSILQDLFKRIIKGNLQVTRPDKKLNFISVQCISKHEVFSKHFAEVLVKEATDFYIDTKTRRNQISVDKLQLQADSIEILLNRKTYSAASIQDINQNPAKLAAGVSAEFAMRDKFILQTMYAEVVKNLELSKIAMAQETPVIQVVDSPILPLEKIRLGKLKGIVFGGLIGGVLVIASLILRKTYRDILG
ncbi:MULTISPECIES: lipopolysaccharide biosynthesis protein [Chitinophaga]|uniref:lipopolysaccharide biosynthesis protein n=1 Tax=Chitinophaga TaxID=79328 RepID=UPI001156D118|nr:lipopolysaccharide biosynthesis protein [Chitinophaga polysaccharea]